MSQTETTKPIFFTQFVPPNGNKVTQIIDRPEAIADKATELAAFGWRFEVEILTTREVSITCTLEDDAGDLIADVGRIVPNGPGVADAVDEIVNEAYELLAKGRNP